jgi:hypothetical protein
MDEFKKVILIALEEIKVKKTTGSIYQLDKNMLDQMAELSINISNHMYNLRPIYFL